MIPYYSVKTIPLLNLDTFSFFFFLAFVIGYLFTFYRSREKGIRWPEFNEFFIFTAIPACFGAHFFAVLAYRRHELADNPDLLLRMNVGLASLGGLLSFLLFFLLFIKLKKNTANWRVWLDVAAQGFIVGLLTGRIGCALIHDHLGSETNFFLGIQLPSGAVRHELGLYEALYLLVVMLPVSIFVNSKYKLSSGLQAALFGLLYAPARFYFDFLRIGEARYSGLTPAQYGCIVVFIAAVYVYRKSEYVPQ